MPATMHGACCRWPSWIVLVFGGPAVTRGEGDQQVGQFFTFAMLTSTSSRSPPFIMGWVVALIQRGSGGHAADRRAGHRRPSRSPTAPTSADVAESMRRRDRLPGPDLPSTPASGRDPALRDVIAPRPRRAARSGSSGPVGSGKTHPRLRDPAPLRGRGRAGLHRRHRREPDRAERTLRSSIAMVPQDSFLFSMTLGRERRLSGFPRWTPVTEIVAEAVDAGAADQATSPSCRAAWRTDGGRARRHAVGRPTATHGAWREPSPCDPKILILDDTLSSVDAATEKAIQDEPGGGLRRPHRRDRLPPGQQRCATATLIIVLEEGRIVEQRDPRGAASLRAALRSADASSRP